MDSGTARDMKRNLTTEQDFLVRRNSNLWLQMAALVGIAFAVLYLSSSHLQTIAAWLYHVVVLLVLGMLAFVGYLQVQRNRDLLLMTEFQNALFTSTARLNYRFCLIAKRDGSIAYYDPGFQLLFPHLANQSNKMLDDLFARKQLPEALANDLLKLLQQDQSGVLLVPFTSVEGAQTTLVVHVDPLPKPRGYVAIRGREYVARRNGAMDAASTAGTPQHRAPSVAATPAPNPASSMVQHVLETLEMPAYATNADGIFIFANAALSNALGYADGELVRTGVRATSLVLQAQGTTGNSLSRDAFDGETLFAHKNGSIAKFHVRQDSWQQADGSYGGSFGFLMTATAQAPAQPTIAVSGAAQPAEKIIASLLNALPSAVALLRADATVREANQSFEQLTQSMETVRRGGSFYGMFTEESRAAVEQLLQQLQRNQSIAGPVDVALATSTPRSASLTLTRIASEAGSESLIFAHVMDTTEQKNLEMRFSHSQKMQAVGQLAGGVAHDFNNLLTAMIGFCDLLLMRHPAGDQSFADIMQIKQNANRAANLVRQLLAFSRKQTLQPKLLDITDVLAELSHLLRRLLGENVELKMVHGRDIGMVRADQGQLEQVLINLAVNARDAMAGTGGTLSIQTRITLISPAQPLARDMIAPTDDDIIGNGEYVQVDITDTGCGIPREMVQKIFEPFFSTKEIGSGTGLGLATVYGIVKQTGGFVYVKSTLGSGTTFSLFFPRQSEEAMAQQTAAEVQEQAKSDDLTGVATILLVEDETPVRTFAARALRNKGYTVIEADCAEAGLEIAQTQGNSIQLVLSDVIMPGMNGPDMVEELLGQLPHLKVIFMSGYAEDVLNNYGSQRGDFHFLPKPFTLKQLASKVKEVTEGN